MYKLLPDYMDILKVYFKSYYTDHDISYYKNQCLEWHRIFYDFLKNLQKKNENCWKICKKSKNFEKIAKNEKILKILEKIEKFGKNRKLKKKIQKSKFFIRKLKILLTLETIRRI